MTDIKKLVKRLREASEAYYAGDPSPLSDAEFDELRDELEAADPKNSFLTEVGAAPSDSDSALQKVPHEIPMGSLDKFRADIALAQFATWRNTVSKSGVALELSVQLKLDGLSIEAIYENGKFVQAITRGDGEIGDDVTHTIKNAQGLPKTISVKSRVSVRFEAMLRLADWKKHFPGTKNPRNTAAGVVRRTDAKGSKHLTAYAFDVLFDNNGFKTEADRIKWLKDEGFQTTPNRVVKADEVEKIIKGIIDRRDRMPIEIDGAVIKLNRISDQKVLDDLGDDHGRPRWARAWKFPSMGAHSTVLDVEWAVGTQGTINPVAKVAPVEVGGTTIRNVTLHNMDEIERLGVQIGDEVEVIRAGDVIPKIVRVVKQGKKRREIIIDACPACGSPVKRSGPKLLCKNAFTCVGSQFKKIQKWIKKRDIMFLGESSLQKLWDAGVVRKISDLYHMPIDSMVDEGGLGKAMATKILAEIEKSRKCSLADFIGSLSLDMLGRREAANLVALGVDTLGEWRLLTEVQIAKLPGYQSTKARRISQGVLVNWSLIIDIASELTITSGKPKVKGGKLSGQSFCFTGTMERKRGDLETLVADNGGSCRSVSRELNFLVMADPKSTSSKAVKAKKLGVVIISEADFISRT